ncbi:iron efflux ABC transporter ATP-binding subunit FetA [Tatumella citrea]|uniref:ABC transporter ATP-binding protein n=1 Tax=Tatumella citrea TaxID=53336 RepID=A0A1Y0LA57_TATCI|nr:iron ABC transporter ATP-binding protein FetA [Tatumella citrea]ARU94539.1 ABC transporter ATP-binding protein [Tatumella citrea]ARU98577.1 ABC transporter ATP-binding protein [Tatumella citrea]
MEKSPPLLELSNICFRAGNTPILNDISLSLRPGEFTLITGPSGCGKSTLLKIASSLISADSGNIRFDGKSIDSYSPEEYRRQVSYCAQTPALFGETVEDNLSFPWQLRQKKADAQQLKQDLQRLALPENLLSKPVTELSGGEKQRVSLLRNLQFLPRVLLLDEITSALDDSNKRRVNDLIHQYVREKNLGVLWVTHDRNEINHADNVITLTANQPRETTNEPA